MKILVTGATGFIGQHLVKALLSEKHEVIATSTNWQKASMCSWFGEVEYREYKFAQIFDEKDLFAYFDKPDLLIHLAWQGLPNFKAPFHIDEVLISQIHFLKNIIQNGLKGLVVTGTCLEYGMKDGSLSEDMPTSPTTAYGIAKDVLRKYIEILCQRYGGFSFKWVRLFYMYGEGQHANSLIPQLQKAVDNKEEEFKMSPGQQLRDFLSIEEVVKYLIKISFQKHFSGIINCCSGCPVSVEQFVRNYLRETGHMIKLNLGAYAYPDYEVMGFWGDNRKLIKILAI